MPPPRLRHSFPPPPPAPPGPTPTSVASGTSRWLRWCDGADGVGWRGDLVVGDTGTGDRTSASGLDLVHCRCMTYHDLARKMSEVPFKPFRIRLVNNTTYDVTEP